MSYRCRVTPSNSLHGVPHGEPICLSAPFHVNVSEPICADADQFCSFAHHQALACLVALSGLGGSLSINAVRSTWCQDSPSCGLSHCYHSADSYAVMSYWIPLVWILGARDCLWSCVVSRTPRFLRGLAGGQPRIDGSLQEPGYQLYSCLR